MEMIAKLTGDQIREQIGNQTEMSNETTTEMIPEIILELTTILTGDQVVIGNQDGHLTLMYNAELTTYIHEFLPCILPSIVCLYSLHVHDLLLQHPCHVFFGRVGDGTAFLVLEEVNASVPGFGSVQVTKYL